MHRLHIDILHPLLALGMPWKHEHVIFFGGNFFLSHYQERKEVWGGEESLREQGTGTETKGNSTCFPMFPKHVPRTLRENPSLILSPIWGQQNTSNPKTECTRESTRIWTFVTLPFLGEIHWNGTIGNISVVWFIFISPKIDLTCVQIFAAICCNFDAGGHRHVEVTTVDIPSNHVTRNLFCYSDLRQDNFLTH